VTWRFVACLVASTVAADRAIDTLQGKIVGVADGDTVTVLDEEKAQHRVRLLAIDAPESNQPYSARPKQARMAGCWG